MAENHTTAPHTVHPEGAEDNTGRSRHPRRLIGGVVLALLISTPGILAFMTVWFVNPATEQASTVGPADAIVLFAGSTDRLRTAVELADAGLAQNLVIPNGADVAPDLCSRETSYLVHCPDSDRINTAGEARAIGRLADESGWSRVIAVTSIYHVRRATSLLAQCFDGTITAVSPEDGIDLDDWMSNLPHEWAGFLLDAVLRPGC